MRRLISASFALALIATPAAAGMWHRHGGFHGPGMGWGGPHFYRPGPSFYPQPRYYGGFGQRSYGYRNYGYRSFGYRDYGSWGGSYSYTYCAPEQGAPVYDAYGTIIACVRQW